MAFVGLKKVHISLASVQLSLLCLTPLLSLSDALELPSVDAHHELAALPETTSWWAKVGDRMFYSPPTSLLGLSQNVSDYYLVMGSKSALSADMKKHVVGNHGRWHIMHLPQGPSLLELSAECRTGDRRSSLSSLIQLKSGTVLTEGFPAYPLSSGYQHPLDEAGQDLEKSAVEHVSAESTMGFLQKLVEFPTRSWSNSEESDKVERFLKQQFEDTGLQTCYQNFQSKGKTLTNVIAFMPGAQSGGSLTVGAHYDSRPFDGAAPGAEDNGSGVASLLALAKAFTLSKATPQKPVYFVAFAGEEPGLLGSKQFASALKSGSLPAECSTATNGLFLQSSKKRRTDTHQHQAIIMDEIGWVSPKLSKPTVNLESYDALGHQVMEHLRHSSQMHNGDTLDIVHNNAPFGSDHMSWLDNGMQAALTINGDDDGYPHYHQSTDTLDNVNAEYMTKIAKMNMGGVIRLSMA